MKPIKIEVYLVKDNNRLIINKGGQFIIKSNLSDDELQKFIVEYLKQNM